MSTPVDPVGGPLIAPAPAAPRVDRSRRSDDDGRRPPGDQGRQPQREQPGAEDGGDGLPHVDVRV